jgi:prophage regulatory protein
MRIVFRRLKDVLSATGKSSSRLYEDIQNGIFPPSVAIGPQARAWPDHEINAINAARLRSASESELKQLVTNMVAARAAVSNQLEAA